MPDMPASASPAQASKAPEPSRATVRDDSGHLLPCPFCSGVAVVDVNHPLGKWRVRCLGCQCCTDLIKPHSATVATWNRRTPPEVKIDA
jgi:hypothetical protein